MSRIQAIRKQRAEERAVHRLLLSDDFELM